MPERSRVLVVGARGFVGSHLVPVASAGGFEVVTASRQEGAADLKLDLLDPSSIDAALSDSSPDVVVNLGAMASVAASWDEADESRSVNVEGVANLLRAARGATRPPFIICLSSAEIYGEVPREAQPITEDREASPVTPYGRGKAAMEDLCVLEGRDRGLGVAVVRSFNLLGPGQAPEYVAVGIARQIAVAETEGRDPATVKLGNPHAARDFTDVRDGARALVALCEQELAGTFNLCSGVATKVADLATGLAEHSSLAIEISTDPELSRPADVPVVQGSAARLVEASGWTPRIPLARTLADMLDDARRTI